LVLLLQTPPWLHLLLPPPPLLPPPLPPPLLLGLVPGTLRGRA
jgi:hypothetical protein